MFYINHAKLHTKLNWSFHLKITNIPLTGQPTNPMTVHTKTPFWNIRPLLHQLAKCFTGQFKSMFNPCDEVCTVVKMYYNHKLVMFKMEIISFSDLLKYMLQMKLCQNSALMCTRQCSTEIYSQCRNLNLCTTDMKTTLGLY